MLRTQHIISFNSYNSVSYVLFLFPLYRQENQGLEIVKRDGHTGKYLRQAADSNQAARLRAPAINPHFILHLHAAKEGWRKSGLGEGCPEGPDLRLYSHSPAPVPSVLTPRPLDELSGEP